MARAAEAARGTRPHAQRLLARAAMNGASLEPDNVAVRCSRRSSGPDDPPAHPRASVRGDPRPRPLAVADRGEQVRSQLPRGDRRVPHRTVAGRSYRATPCAASGGSCSTASPSEIHPYDVTVESRDQAEAWDCKWGARGINGGCPAPARRRRTHAAEERTSNSPASIVFDARRSCERRLVRERGPVAADWTPPRRARDARPARGSSSVTDAGAARRARRPHRGVPGPVRRFDAGGPRPGPPRSSGMPRTPRGSTPRGWATTVAGTPSVACGGSSGASSCGWTCRSHWARRSMSGPVSAASGRSGGEATDGPLARRRLARRLAAHRPGSSPTSGAPRNGSPEAFPAAFAAPPGGFEPVRVAATPPGSRGRRDPHFAVLPHQLDPMDHVNNAVYLDHLEDAVAGAGGADDVGALPLELSASNTSSPPVLATAW